MNSSCLSSQPRQCGPLLPPGSTSPALLAAGSNVPQNVLFVRVDSRAALVCVPAKAGTTAFYFWLYHILSGNPWPHRGPPWVQDVASGRWRAMARNSSRGGSIFVSRLHRMPAPKRAAALADRQVFRAALLRHPLQRAESAYLSKVSCHRVGDEADHTRLVSRLVRLAPQWSARRKLDDTGHRRLGRRLARDESATAPERIAPRPPPRRRQLGGQHGGQSSRGQRSPWRSCLEGEDWAAMMEEVLAGPEAQRLDQHFKPQADACALKQLGYHSLSILGSHAAGMKLLAERLGLGGGSLPPLSRAHALKRPNGTRRGRGVFDEAVLGRLERLYAEDMALLAFPSPG